MKRLLFALLMSATIFAPRAAKAVELEDGKLSLNGFGGWEYIRTDGNKVVLPEGEGTREGNYENYLFGMTIRARASDRINIWAQWAYEDHGPSFDDSGNFKVQWVFAEYRAADALRVRVGKVKAPFGLYGDIASIGTARPFLTLPNTMYGPNNSIGSSVLGAAVTGAAGEKWKLDYDAFVGALQFARDNPFVAVTTTNGNLKEELLIDAVGARVMLSPGIEGLRFGGSAYVGRREGGEDEAHSWSAGASVEYVDDLWSFRAEAYRSFTTNHQFAGLALRMTSDSAYAELARYVTPEVQIVARAETGRTRVAGLPIVLPAQTRGFLMHDEGALGVNYWVAPSVVVKVSGHLIAGNQAAFPDPLTIPILLGPAVPRRTWMVMAGMQFSF